MQMSIELVLLLMRQLARPLAEGEVRRMQGLGQLYACLPGHVPEEEEGSEFVFRYEMTINGVVYCFYNRHPRPANVNEDKN